MAHSLMNNKQREKYSNFVYIVKEIESIGITRFCTFLYTFYIVFYMDYVSEINVRMLIEVFTFGNNCQCFNDLIGISTISAVMMLLSC